MRFDDKVNAFVTFQFKTHYEFFTNTSNALDKVNIINEKESHLPDIYIYRIYEEKSTTTNDGDKNVILKSVPNVII